METHVVLDPTELSVEPGGEAVCSVRVRNDGPVVDEYSAQVVGAIADWTVMEADAVRLFPGDEGVLVLHIRPPRVHRIAPGQVPFGVRVVATSGGQASAVVEEGSVEITAFRELEAAIIPRRSRARLAGRHRVAITNLGNVPVTARLLASDREDVLDVRFRRISVDIVPGHTRKVRTRVRPATTSMQAGPEPHLFQVSVEADDAPSIQLQGAMVLRPFVPRWLPVALAAVVVAILLVLALAKRETVQTRATVAPIGAPSPTAAAGGTGAKAASGGGGAGGKPVPVATAAPATPSPQLSPAETNCLAGTVSPVGSSYPADGTAQDGGTAHNDGTLSGGAAYGPGVSGNGSDQAFTFPGGDSRVDVGPHVGQLGTGDLCVSFAVRTTAKSPQALVGNRNTLADGQWWDIRMRPSGLPYAELDHNGATTPGQLVTLTSDGATVNDGGWHTVGLIRRGRLLNLYVDKKLVGSVSTTIVDVSNGADTRFGSDGFISFTGAIDDVLIVAG